MKILIRRTTLFTYIFKNEAEKNHLDNVVCLWTAKAYDK